MDVRFTTTRFADAYEITEVDDFLDRCDRALATGDGSVTTEDVRGARFTPVRFRPGYAMEEVDDFLDDVLAPRLEAAAGGTPSADGADSADAASSSAALSDVGSATSAGSPTGDGTAGAHPAEAKPGLFARLFGRSR